MDKLTWYDEDGRIYCRRGYEVALARLASYEATGLSPDEVTKMGMMFEDSKRYSGRLEGRLKAYGDLGTIARLRELAQADRERRSVVLPCKPSDVTVYQLRGKKHAREVGISPRHVGSASVWGDGHYALHHQGLDDCLDRDLGKTWFLTEEDAEAALKKLKG